MQIRHLIKSGLASHVVALPSDWIRKLKLRRGSLIYITETPASDLVLSTHYEDLPQKEEDEIINIDGKSDTVIFRTIASAYVKNAKRIIIRGKRLYTKTDHIKEVIASLIALEIIEETSEHIIARNFLSLSDVEVDQIIRRLDNIVRSMLLDMVSCIDGPLIDDAIVKRDIEVNKLNFLNSKILINSLKNPSLCQKLSLSPIMILRLSIVNTYLEKIGDEAKKTARIICTLRRDNSRFSRESLFALCNGIIEQYKNTMKAHYQTNIQLSDDVHARRKAILDDIDTLRKKSPPTAEICEHLTSITHYLQDITRTTRYYT
jgi:phosphate uptake regulator